jgi:hypothetical protein
MMRAPILAVPLTLFLATSAIACGPTDGRLAKSVTAGAVLDATWDEAELDQASREKAKALRTQIKQLVATGKDKEALDAEEQVMNILGYKKIWLRCGPGTFAWMKVPKGSTNDAGF